MTVKRSIDFSDPQIKWLREESRRLGISVGEFVRRIVDDRRTISSGHKGS